LRLESSANAETGGVPEMQDLPRDRPRCRPRCRKVASNALRS